MTLDEALVAAMNKAGVPAAVLHVGARDTRDTRDYVEADAVVQELQRKLDAARKRKPATRR